MPSTKIYENLEGIAPHSVELCLTEPIAGRLDIWKMAFGIIKPGSHVLAITHQNYHRVCCEIEDAGFEIRDSMHVLGTEHNRLIVTAMKPLEGNFVQNARKWKVAGFNIDAGRVAHTTVNGGNLADNPHLRKNIAGGNGGKIIATEVERRFNVQHAEGRWPTNIILMHHHTCQQTGTVRVKNASGSVGGHEKSHTGGPGTHCYGEYNRVSWQKYGNEDGFEDIPAWECHINCPVRLLNEQAGVRPGCKSPSNAKPSSKFRPDQGNYMPQGKIHSDTGYASRYYFQATDEQSLLTYLCKMFKSPFSTTILDPFMVTTKVLDAAVDTGCDFVGCYREDIE